MAKSKPVRLPNVRLSHLGICVIDLPKMEKFYTEVMGFAVTDRGQAVGFELIFLSRDPEDHHQIVLSTGRPRDIPANTANPEFGPVINQISFRLETLAELQEAAAYMRASYEKEFICLNHGTAWSLYVDDPEGNKIEIFVDTDWYITQPVAEPFDIDRPASDILAETEARCRAEPSFRLASSWRADIAPVMAQARDRVAS
jgi:catechol-2,3-dioxygenase